ncbi:MAG: glycosyltransferase [Chitinophagales bacterium]
MISLVFPFYNEENRIHLFKNGLKDYNNPHQLIREIILVDDGSTDNTLHHLKSIQLEFSHYAIKVVEVSPNKGKGNAIREGVKVAEEPWILCNDADLSYSMQQIDEWVDNNWIDFSKTNAVYFGSRELGMKRNWVSYHLHRRIIGRIYAFIIRLFTGITVTDTQCGFKLYRAQVAKNIFQIVREDRFAFDIEVFYLLRKNSIEVNLLPLRCEERIDSKVHLIKDSWNMFLAIFRIKRRYD